MLFAILRFATRPDRVGTANAKFWLSAIGYYSGLAIAESALKQSLFYVNCGPKVRRQQCR
jgi:hypothetical protein